MRRLSAPFALATVLLTAACAAGDPASPVESAPSPPAAGGGVDTTPPPIAAPVVTAAPRFSVAAPDGLKPTCLAVPDSVRSSATCPVVAYRGITYWAFSYRDNRLSLAVVGYDSAGVAATAVLEVPGARYIHAIRVEPADSTLVLIAQDAREVTVRWADLP